MKKLSLLLLASVFTFCGCSNDDETKTYVLSLPDYQAESLYLGDSENFDKQWNDNYGSTYIKHLLSDNSKVFEFDCLTVSYENSTTFGFGSDSFAFTNKTSENYSAITKKGVSNQTYIIAGASGYNDVSIRFKDNENPKELEDYRVKGMFVTNSAYAYNSMKEGRGYFGDDEIFGKNDSFKLIIYNLEETQSVEVYLAKGTNLLNKWEWVDLTSLGETKGLRFKLETTKVNDNGPMTPYYFCLDGITVED